MQDKNERGLVGDFFCGAGGASVGIEEFGVKVDFAVNHDQTADPASFQEPSIDIPYDGRYLYL